MKSFIRKVRHDLFYSTSVHRYLFYALGEITLVVIGILIAVQINKWKQDRDDRKLERSTLLEIRSDLVRDTLRIAGDLKSLQQSVLTIKSLIDHVEGRKPLDDELREKFILSYTAHTPLFAEFESASFDLLQDRGLDIISNSELRRRIVEHFTGLYSEAEGWLLNLKNVWSLEGNRLYSNFRISVEEHNNVLMTPNDYAAFIKDKTLMNPFYHFEALLINSIELLNSLMEETRVLLSFINDELGES